MTPRSFSAKAASRATMTSYVMVDVRATPFSEMAPYIEICYAYSGGSGWVTVKKFGLFVTAGGPTAASFADRLLAHTQQAFADTPKKQKNNNNKTFSDSDYNQSHALSLFLECSVGKGAPWGMVLVANPVKCHGKTSSGHKMIRHATPSYIGKDRRSSPKCAAFSGEALCLPGASSTCVCTAHTERMFFASCYFLSGSRNSKRHCSNFGRPFQTCSWKGKASRFPDLVC